MYKLITRLKHTKNREGQNLLAHELLALVQDQERISEEIDQALD